MMREISIFLAALLGVALFSANPAFAQAAVDVMPPLDGRVSFEWGNLLADTLREQAGGLASATVLAVMTFMPNGVAQLIRTFRISQLLEKAVVSAINKTAGAVQGKALSAAVGNEVIERALDFAAFNAPKLFKKLPLNEWREKVIGRITMAENVTIDPQGQGFVAVPR